VSYLVPVRGINVSKCLTLLNRQGAEAVASEVPGYIVSRKKVDAPHLGLDWIEIPDEAYERYARKLPDAIPAVKPGTPIQVVQGPLVGFKGIVTTVYAETNMLVVNLWAFGKTVRHEVSASDVKLLPLPDWV